MSDWMRRSSPTMQSVDEEIRVARRELGPSPDRLSSIGWRLGAATHRTLEWLEDNPCPEGNGSLVDLFTSLAETAAMMEAAAQLDELPDLNGFDDALAAAASTVRSRMGRSGPRSR
jgi:hypothetical protein